MPLTYFWEGPKVVLQVRVFIKPAAIDSNHKDGQGTDIEDHKEGSNNKSEHLDGPAVPRQDMRMQPFLHPWH